MRTADDRELLVTVTSFRITTLGNFTIEDGVEWPGPDDQPILVPGLTFSVVAAYDVSNGLMEEDTPMYAMRCLYWDEAVLDSVTTSQASPGSTQSAASLTCQFNLAQRPARGASVAAQLFLVGNPTPIATFGPVPIQFS